MMLLYQDEYFIAIHKPSGFHVHPHEMAQHRVSRDKVCLYLARDYIGRHVFPVHRLDAGTSGVLLFALSSDSAREICQLFAHRAVHKTYEAMVRGFTPDEGVIDSPFGVDAQGCLVNAKTTYRRIAKVEVPFPVGKKFPTARYSWVEAKPLTGRFHQIRRHFNRITHPLIGDAEHGDSRHNGFVRNQLGIEGLCLKATCLQFQHPWTREAVNIRSPECEKWKKIQSLFATSGEAIDLPPRLGVKPSCRS